MQKTTQAWSWLIYTTVHLTLYRFTVANLKFGIDWSLLNWTWNRFDVLPFVFWLLIPLGVSWKSMDWGYFSFRRWKKIDWWILGLGVVVGFSCMYMVKVVPALQQYYPPFKFPSEAAKWTVLWRVVLWNLSWLPGWDFTFRYFLLRKFSSVWPKWGWCLIPMIEFAYHLKKPWLESTGMLLFSVVATQWCLRRKNSLLPIIVHVAIELGFSVFRLI